MKLRAQYLLAVTSRPIFNSDIEKIADRNQKYEFIYEQVYEFISDFLDAYEVALSPVITVSRLEGFEGSEPFDMIVGTARAQVTFETWADIQHVIDMTIPIIRGELYRPAVVYIDGRPAVLSTYVLESVVAQDTSYVPVLRDLYGPDPDISRKIRIERGLYAPPLESEDVRPIYEIYNPSMIPRL